MSFSERYEARFPSCGRRKQCRSATDDVPRENSTFQRSVRASRSSSAAASSVSPPSLPTHLSRNELPDNGRHVDSHLCRQLLPSTRPRDVIFAYEPATGFSARGLSLPSYTLVQRDASGRASRFFVVCGGRQPEAIIITLMQRLKLTRVQLAVGLNSSIISFVGTVCLRPRAGLDLSRRLRR